ncbi:hypothetical protein CIT25_01575 [Mesorhizobium mediterraneum]|uniref:Uncharacterized protein n=1 Tax=Mesorhizobium mediterraneum TaxID=43617 RepID=A0AB36RGX6_9HYPH|nr:hypothetical protein CIT25_01575 [Mesorhizobium mediterraneum]
MWAVDPLRDDTAPRNRQRSPSAWPRTNNEATSFKGKRHDGQVKDEREHFTICPVCGQEIDMRDLGEALHHAMPSHKPLKYPD